MTATPERPSHSSAEQVVEIALGAAMPLRPSVQSLARVALDALTEAGYTLTPPPADCPSCGQRPGNHWISCPIGGPI